MPVKDQPIGPLFTRLGIIRLGHKETKMRNGKPVLDKRGKPVKYPVADEHFVLTDAPELVQWYGETPTELNVFWPFNDVDRNVDDAYRLYGAGSIICRGDGETMDICLKGADFVVSNGVCIKPFTENGEHFNPGDIVPCNGPGDDGRYPKCQGCEIRSYPKVMIQEAMAAGLFGYYQIGSGSTSKHGRANIRGALEATREFVRFLTGRPHLALIPMILSLRVQSVSVPMTDPKTGDRYRARMDKPILQLIPHPDWVKVQTAAMMESVYQPLAIPIPMQRAQLQPPITIQDLPEEPDSDEGAFGDDAFRYTSQPTDMDFDEADFTQPNHVNQPAVLDQREPAAQTAYPDDALRAFKASIQATAQQRFARGQTGPPTGGNHGLSVKLLNDILGGDDNRRLLTAWIFDLPTQRFTSNDLSGAQVSALLDKLQPTKDDGKWIPTHDANVEQFKQALRVARQDMGQLPLSLPDQQVPADQTLDDGLPAEPDQIPDDGLPIHDISTWGQFWSTVSTNLKINKSNALKLLGLKDQAEIPGKFYEDKYQTIYRAVRNLAAEPDQEDA